MLLPRGEAGKDFINQLTRLVGLFNSKTVWEKVAISLIHIFIPMMLQKPSSKSKARENSKYLLSRLENWARGNISDIMSECREVQKRLTKSNSIKIANLRKLFCKRMLEGKVREATKLIDNENQTGILPNNEETIQLLMNKHPVRNKRDGPEVIPSSTVEPIIFEEIDGAAIQNAAKNTFGSGGPTLIDADGWKHILCSKSYGKA
ncbi:MAG: hypothetical protein GY816_16330, partial [Cytophagales bacterium]|nr:hypothetical protein [Cytophagales bacterium]